MCVRISFETRANCAKRAQELRQQATADDGRVCSTENGSGRRVPVAATVGGRRAATMTMKTAKTIIRWANALEVIAIY